MKIGDYVRTKNGEIGKLVNVEVYYVLGQDDKDKYSCVLFNNSYIPCVVLNDFIVRKGQLIDLIEEGDYVNGHLVLNVIDFNDNTRNLSLEKIYDSTIAEEDIKSIVTHETFESIEYKVGE